MVPYHVDELSFAAPDGWIDRSINIFAKPSGEISVNVTRDDLKGVALTPYVARQLKELAKSWPRFTLLGQRERAVGALPGYEARLQWAPQGVLLYQHQVYVAYYGSALTFTASSPKKLAAQCDAYLDALLATIKFRRQ